MMEWLDLFLVTKLLLDYGLCRETLNSEKRFPIKITIFVPYSLQVLLYPFTSLLAEFGGCLGLFLGFSFVTVSDGVKSLAKWLKKNINLF